MSNGAYFHDTTDAATRSFELNKKVKSKKGKRTISVRFRSQEDFDDFCNRIDAKLQVKKKLDSKGNTINVVKPYKFVSSSKGLDFLF